ncbi:2-hydroxyacyl-CoA dehydratase subunit D [Thermodesulfobacteriota bacterium]
MDNRFAQAYENRHRIGAEWKNSGRKVLGYLYAAVPKELIYAADILPVQLCMSEETHSDANARLPEYVCDFAESVLAQGLDGTYDYLDGAVMAHLCEAARGFGGVWQLNVEKPFFHFLTPPAEVTPGALKYYFHELERLKKALEQLSGNTITPATLNDAIDIYNENRTMIKQIYLMRKEEAFSVSGEETVDIIKSALVMPPEDHNEILSAYLQSLSERKMQRPAIRLLLSCLIPEEVTFSDQNLMKILEELGAEVVFDDLGWGSRYFWDLVEKRDDPFESLVNYYVGRIPCPYRFPIIPLADYMKEKALEYKADAAIFLLPKFCDPVAFSLPAIEEKFDQEKIPYLRMETSHSMSLAAMKTRVEAFLEIVKRKKS